MLKAIGVFLVVSACALSQMNTSQLEGTVTDPAGAAVPAAEVTVTNVATGTVFKTVTNERGEWALPSMQAATYKVAITKAGFKAGVVPAVQMNSGVPATVDMKLELGQATEVIEVTAGVDRSGKGRV